MLPKFLHSYMFPAEYIYKQCMCPMYISPGLLVYCYECALISEKYAVLMYLSSFIQEMEKLTLRSF